MKAKIVFFLFLIVATLYGQGEEAVRLKILSCNLQYGEQASLEELAAFIGEQNPDIVALQEVDCRTFRDRTPHQHGKDFITELGFRTGMLTAYGKTIPHAGGYYGIGILSKYPLASVERIYLPLTENGKEQRAILVADVEFKDNQYFTFACTHLDYTNTEERQLQVEKLNEVLLKKSYPVALAGDFNTEADSKEIKDGMKAWKQVCNQEPTFSIDKPRNKIDYIFCRPSDKWASVDAEVYRVNLSDHLFISATLELNTKK
ncbi:MAG: endonuclease/exonuclease/phosphatase family protein [Tannerella sp.]|jgi:endonuclease/exonuclease/phosphatase family metal-dependent hydrolase|nr:endonuclease/exonuclease/phosphatase family protein [Tannerella sp.]